MVTKKAVWTLSIKKKALKVLEKMGSRERARIVEYLEERVMVSPDPHALGRPLTCSLKGLWRYRVGDYRIVCHLDGTQLTVLVVDIGHRSSIYDDMS